jgi:DNA-binding MarR family transcriptional regulator
MEKNNLVVRVRSAKDERSVQISLTEVGRCLEEKLLDVPLALCRNHNVELKRIEALRDNIKDLMETVMS